MEERRHLSQALRTVASVRRRDKWEGRGSDAPAFFVASSPFRQGTAPRLAIRVHGPTLLLSYSHVLRALPKWSAEKTPITTKPRHPAKSAGSVPAGIPWRTRKKLPARRLTNPQTKLTSGDERPTPLGVAKGVGKASPLKPLARCGKELQMNSPEKNIAM